MWRIEGAAAFERGSNGRVGELAGCVMSAYEFVVVGFALPRYVCARAWEPAKWACVNGGVCVSDGEFAVVYLAVYEFDYCYAFSLVVLDKGVECYSNYVGSGALGFGVDDEASVKGGR